MLKLLVTGGCSGFSSPELLLQLLQHFSHCPNQIKQIHSLLITHGFFLNHTSSWKTVLIYNTLIRSYLSMGLSRTSLLLFTHMIAHGLSPNHLTFPSLIKAASCSPSSGPIVHAQALKWGVLRDPFVQTSFVRLYSEVSNIRSARKMFVEIPHPCIVACNALLDAFGRNGDMGSAFLYFESMPQKDVVSWTSVINGFVMNGRFVDALRLFAKMMVHEDVVSGSVKPNEATFVTVLSSCANLDGTGLYQGKQIHGYFIKNEFSLSAVMGTALVDLYGKAGCLETAIRVFNRIEVKEVFTWNAMISSLACHGRAKQALCMFEKMKAQGFSPNEVTFVAILTACARAKLVDLGLKLFRSMSRRYGVVPIMEHYGCVVDLMGRAGLLRDAVEFVISMPFLPDASVLGALFGACKIHGDVQLGNEVGKKLLELQPKHCGRYVVLSNINAVGERWGDAADWRKVMAESKIRKIPACSLIGSIKVDSLSG
ncbi:putative pentatricopeptide repeat-containing protein At1g10330 [Carica papaya]|uniref:putative pentatricopeptide repeat-containing protein At1g10330 n=1 Tax=Carica papaya TaxID=3649 RepID=UPI000B8C72CE|nr:putative pentatricopeptide repeat-containing protein At1g10330 [Carica papaya]XP_021888508.1 putative pentatricopeptide repeat-containing protein At1g10330 [Carica papaya]XP_021888516.1 putative pentatricopeptide repeat-containing protein At1g10330 [Carica papaya]